MGFTVNKPQFDVAILPPGTPLFIKVNGGTGKWYNFKANCLVVKVTPLELTVTYVVEDTSNQDYSDTDDDADTTFLKGKKYKTEIRKIDIHMAVGGHMTIEKLVIDTHVERER